MNFASNISETQDSGVDNIAKQTNAKNVNWFDEHPFSKIAKKAFEAQARESQKKKLASVTQPIDIKQLPLWSDEVRAVPNGILRSALFGAVKSGSKRYIDGELIASVAGVVMRYTGQSLDQGDLGVWEAVLHISKEYKLGNKCYATSYQILGLLGLTDTGSNRRILVKRLTRLVATALDIEQGRYHYTGSLINEIDRDAVTGMLTIEINPKIIALYQYDQYTKIHFELCRELKKPLAQWLFRFYSSHAKPHPYKIETIHGLCRSDAKSLNDFKKNTLKNALNEVSVVSAKYGLNFQYEIKNNLLHITKSGSSSQVRHLLKK